MVDHQRRYNRFIEMCKNRKLQEDIYTEKHHILPRSLGGSNSIDNIIRLTGREHFVAHMILWKLYGGTMTYSFWRMCNSDSQNGFSNWLTSRQYESLRKDRAKEQSDRMSNGKQPSYGLRGDQVKWYGSRRTEEQKKNIGDGYKRWWYSLSEERRQQICDKRRKGKLHSDETKLAMSKAKKGRVWVSKGEDTLLISIEDFEENYKALGWDIGRYVPEEVKEKRAIAVSKSRKGLKESKEIRKRKSEAKTGCIWINNGDVRKFIKEEIAKEFLEKPNSEWKRGFKISESP